MKRRNGRKPKRLLLKVFIFAILAVSVYIFALAGSDGEYTSPDASPARAASPTRLQAEESSNRPPADFPLFTAEVSVNNIEDTQYLKLVNRDRGITAPVCNTRLTTVWPDMPARASYVSLHKTAFSAMRELFTAAQNANINGLFIASGYRTHEEQRYLHDNAVDKAYVMPPGHSEHQLGLAADILSSADIPSMRGSEEARWLAENAPEFGLILRYPEDKIDITGVPYEPWHFRYVGRVHAWFMGQRDFVLEEYIAYLQANGGYQAEFAGRTYYVLYQRPENGMIFVPEHSNFWISSANTGGYIVTAWR